MSNTFFTVLVNLLTLIIKNTLLVHVSSGSLTNVTTDMTFDFHHVLVNVVIENNIN